jgi:hypothetical protein
MPLSLNSHFLYYINSNNRINASDSGSSFSIKINIPPTQDGSTYDRVVVLGASIPISFYLIQVGLNTFTVTENGTIRTIALTAGNYSRPQLQTELKKQLTNQQPVSYNYNVTFPSSSSPQTGLWTFTTGNLLPTSFSIGNYLYEVLGFSKGSTPSFNAGTLICTNVIKLQSDDAIYIMSDIHNGARGILQEIYCNSNSFSLINYTNVNVELYSKEFNKKDSNCFRFWITDENFTPLNLNGLNMNMTVCFYQNNNHPLVAKEDIMISSIEKLQVAKEQQLKEGLLRADKTTVSKNLDGIVTTNGEVVSIKQDNKKPQQDVTISALSKLEQEEREYKLELDPYYNPKQMIIGGI